MSRPKRQKIDREGTAAYAASQPLFDSLRNATSKLSEQEAHLTTARDVVQTLHVKIANNDHHLSIERHRTYMDAAVKAWHSATETYCAIFEQLVTITATDPTEGREKGERYEEFVSLLETARKAEETAKKFDAAHDAGSAESEDEEEEDESSEPVAHTNGTGKRPMGGSEDEETSEKQQKTNQQEASNTNSKAIPNPPPAKPSALSDDIRYDKSGAKILWQDGALKVPYQSLKPDEKRAWDIVKTRKRRKEKRAKMKKGQQAEVGSPLAFPFAQVPGVEYEDVSAEVEARIKAKADKKAAAKAKNTEKKRKRESGDCFGGAAVDSGFTNAGGEAEGDPLNEVDGSLKEKPAKKRARQSEEKDEVEAAAGAAKTKQPMPSEATSKSKRKKSLNAEEDTENDPSSGNASRKRKKTKAC